MMPLAFCEREVDLARMTICRDGDRLVARLRLATDRIEPTYQTGGFNDAWVHVSSGNGYVRHDEVFDLDAGVACYDYSSNETGRLWLRPIAEWEQIVNGRPRFEPLSWRHRA